MKLIVGGFGQGMLEAALQSYGGGPVADGAICSLQDACGAHAVDNLHLFIRRELEAGRPPSDAVGQILAQNPDVILICQEIGCGVVPTDAFDRDWREQTGRICCMIAARAQGVVRVFCGIPTVIKGE